MSEEQKLIKISEIIMRHLHQRYPNSFEQTGLTQETVISILEKKRELLADKQGLSHIINILDNAIRTKINGPNSILRETDTTKFSMDTGATIPYDTYVNQNLDTTSKPSFKLNPATKAANDNSSNTMSDSPITHTVSNSQFKSGGVLQTYQEENILSERMNTKFLPNENNTTIKLHIDSKDRDFETYKHANGYVIDLDDKALMRVKEIVLTDIILLDSSQTEMSSDNLTIPPYLILEIEGLPKRSNDTNAGSNDNLEDAFAILKNYEIQNGYKYYNDINIKKIYKNTIGIEKLKINFRLPDGSLFNFGVENDELRRTVSLLSFDIVLSA